MWRDMYWQDGNNMWLQPNPEYVTWYVLTRWKQYVVTTKPWICDVIYTDKRETICGYNQTLNMWRDMYWQEGNNMWLQPNHEYVTSYVLTRWKQYVVTTKPWICDVICTDKMETICGYNQTLNMWRDIYWQEGNNMWLQPNPAYVTWYVLTRWKQYVVTTKPWICDVICTDKIETICGYHQTLNMWRDMYWQEGNNMWLQPNPEYVTWYVLTRGKQYVATTKPWICGVIYTDKRETICDVICTDKMETICGYNQTLNMWRDIYWQEGNNMWLQSNPEYVTWYVLKRGKQYVVTTKPWICDVIYTDKRETICGYNQTINMWRDMYWQDRNNMWRDMYWQGRNNMWLQPNPEYVTWYVLTRWKQYVVTTKPWICDVIYTDKRETICGYNQTINMWRDMYWQDRNNMWRDMYWQDGNNMWLQPNPEYVTWYILTRGKQYVVTTKPSICDVICTDKIETICGYNQTLNMWRDMYWQDGNNMWLQPNHEYVTWYVLTRGKQYVVTTKPSICDVICTDKMETICGYNQTLNMWRDMYWQEGNNMWLQPNHEYVTWYVLTRRKQCVVTTKPWICMYWQNGYNTLVQPNPEYVTWYIGPIDKTKQ